MTDVWVKATEYGDRNGATLVRYASIGGMELDAWVASNDVTPRTDGAAPDESKLRAACEMALALIDPADYATAVGGPGRREVVDALRAALAATEPAETCEHCRWFDPDTGEWDSCRKAAVGVHMWPDAQTSACSHFESWPG